jgi:hypothetical protein
MIMMKQLKATIFGRLRCMYGEQWIWTLNWRIFSHWRKVNCDWLGVIKWGFHCKLKINFSKSPEVIKVCTEVELKPLHWFISLSGLGWKMFLRWVTWMRTEGCLSCVGSCIKLESIMYYCLDSKLKLHNMSNHLFIKYNYLYRFAFI